MKNNNKDSENHKGSFLSLSLRPFFFFCFFIVEIDIHLERNLLYNMEKEGNKMCRRKATT